MLKLTDSDVTFSFWTLPYDYDSFRKKILYRIYQTFYRFIPSFLFNLYLLLVYLHSHSGQVLMP